MADDAVERGGDYVAVDENAHLLSRNAKPPSQGYFASFPGSIKFLVWNEFCERFSFYGMRTILALYLVQHLRLSENESTELVHLFIVACYATPLLGAFISDCYWVRSVPCRAFFLLFFQVLVLDF
jgi:dipeptide/tripeptide permease